MRDRGDPFRELAESLGQLDPGLSAAERTAFIAQAKKQMATGTEGLRDVVAGLGFPRAIRCLVVIDQFEELFTSGVTKGEQVRYIDTLLAAAAPKTDSRIHVVITLRADFYSQCWVHQELPKRIAANQFAVQRMSKEQLREAIEKPLTLAGVHAEPGLVDTLLAEVGDEPGNLPLLEHALEQLWEKRTSGMITNAAYEEIGRLKGSLRKHADQAYQTLGDEKKRAIARKILVRLTQLGEGSQDTRRRAPKAELIASAGGEAEGELVLNKLVSARLITVGEEQQTRRDVVEVAHEALIREWPLLREWVSEDREDLRVERAILQAAGEWKTFGKDSGALLKGARLIQAEEWSARHARELPKEASEFLRASIADRDEELQKEKDRQQEQIDSAKRLSAEAEARAVAEQRARESAEGRALSEARVAEAARKSATRTTWFSAALAFLLFGSLVLVWYAQRQRAVAESRQLASQAEEAQNNGDPLTGLKLAIQAGRRYKTEEAYRALSSALSYPRPVLIIKGGTKFPPSVDISPDGTRVASASGDNTAQVYAVDTGRLLAKLSGHKEVVTNVSFSLDGKRAVTVSNDKTARIWDSDSGRLVATLIGHQDRVYHAEFSKDGKQVVTDGADHTARVWDAESGRSMVVLKGDQEDFYLSSFCPDGKTVVTNEVGTARIWDTNSGRSLVALKADGSGSTFSEDCKRRLTFGGQSYARLWDTMNGHLITTMRGTPQGNVVAALSPDKELAIIAGGDDTAQVWTVEKGELLGSLSGHQKKINSVAFSEDGKLLITASDDKTARVWGLTDEEAMPSTTLTGHQSGVVYAFFSQNGKRLVTASNDGMARVWNLDSGRGRMILGDQEESSRVFISPSGKRAITIDDMVRVRDAQSGEVVSMLGSYERRNGVDALFSEDNKRVLIKRLGGMEVWDVDSGRLFLKLSQDQSCGYSAALSENGKRLANICKDNTVNIWDVDNRRLIATLRGHEKDVYRVLFSPDDKLVLTASKDMTARIWDAESGYSLVTLMGHEGTVDNAAFSPDSKHVVTASQDKTARVWDAKSGRPLVTLKGHQDFVNTAVFSPDGRWVVTASADKTARIWDAENGRSLVTLTGHEDAVNSAVFSRDVKRVVTASGDNTARIWDAKSGRLLETLSGLGDSVDHAAFIMDGRQVITASIDGTARIYIVDFEDLLNWAETQLPKEVGQ